MLAFLALHQEAAPDIALVPQVGAILRAYGQAHRNRSWDVPARLQYLWLAKPPRAADLRLGLDFADVAYPRETGLNLRWLFRPEVDSDGRARAGYDALTASLTGKATQAAVRRLALARLGDVPLSDGRTVTFGDVAEGSGKNLERFHAQRVAERAVGPNPRALRLDPELGALGHFRFFAVPVGRAERRPGGAVRVQVNRFLVYVLDSFDFSKPFEPLGFFRSPGVVSDKPGDGVLLTNESYRSYRAASGRGGDFLVMSDLRAVRAHLTDEFRP